MNGLPFFDRVEPETVDVLLVTHFHLDHVGSLPYFTERTKFKGRVFMTHPTKAVTRLLLGDYRRLTTLKKATETGNSNIENDDPSSVLYTEAELQACVDKIELIDYHQTISLSKHGGLKFHALNAGHVLGAAMFLIEFGGGRTILYTGDYSMEEDRHLMAAEIPSVRPDVLIVESTYGIQVHASRKERETRFTSTIERVVNRGGRCLIPVFALGRAQELLLILDEHWKNNPQLHGIPIFYASKMANRALRVCQTYANMMNARIRAQMDVANPFRFQHISNLKSIDPTSFDDRGPCVVFASPGMLQSGVSRKLFDRWASEPNNGVMIAGYAVENTLAKEIMNHPTEVVTMEGRRQPLNCLVDYVSFSAHVDFMQNRNFISKVQPNNIILVHGSKDQMGSLKNALMHQYRQLPENKRPVVTMPPNLQPVKIHFARRRSAKVMGSLADRQRFHNNDDGEDTKPSTATDMMPKEGESVQGILVTQNFQSKIVSPEDLPTYTPLRVGSLSSKLHVPFSSGTKAAASLRFFLNEMFVGVTEVQKKQEDEEMNGDEEKDVVVFGLHNDEVTVTTGKTRGIATIEWKASTVCDMLADSVVALLMHSQTSAASIRLAGEPCCSPRADGVHGGQVEQETKKVENNVENSVKKEENIDEDGSNQEPVNKKMRSEGIKKEENNNGAPSTTKSIQRMERILRLFHHTLLEQFSTVEATYESHKACFEIETDSGLESGPLPDDGMLICNVTAEFVNTGDDDNVKISVECADEKLAANVRECLMNVAYSTAPLKL